MADSAKKRRVFGEIHLKFVCGDMMARAPHVQSICAFATGLYFDVNAIALHGMRAGRSGNTVSMLLANAQTSEDCANIGMRAVR